MYSVKAGKLVTINEDHSCLIKYGTHFVPTDGESSVAKTVELDKFDKFEAYEEVPDIGQKRLGTNWVLVEKIKDGETIVKSETNNTW